MNKNIYYFGWPSSLGGADTKLAHLLDLLYLNFDITLIPNFEYQLNDTYWINYLRKRNIKYSLIEDLPSKLDGVAFSMSNELFLKDKKYQIAKDKGLDVIWSSEMMWHFDGELQAIAEGSIDKVLYVSEIQKKHLKYSDNTPFTITGNYINPKYFPFQEREDSDEIVIGRLSRADVLKYPEDFPVFYELLDVPKARFRVMGWNSDLSLKYKWHHFDDRWDLLEPEEESQVDFLQSLDFFIYPLGHRFIESWGRSTVEAMLTGCIPFVQSGHNLENLILHGVSGYVCDDILDYQKYLDILIGDSEYRSVVSKQCRKYAEEKICDRATHLNIWREAFEI